MWDLQNILQGLNMAILFWNMVIMIILKVDNARLEREKEARKQDTIDTTLNGLLN